MPELKGFSERKLSQNLSEVEGKAAPYRNIKQKLPVFRTICPNHREFCLALFSCKKQDQTNAP